MLIYEISKDEKNIDALLKFHLLYQVVELFIERIYLQKVLELVKDSKLSTKGPHEIKEELTGISNEKNRLNILFSGLGPCRELKEVCQKFQNNSVDTGTAEILYKIRNELIHNYRKITPPQKEILNEINNTFEAVVLDMLIKFKYVDAKENVTANTKESQETE